MSISPKNAAIAAQLVGLGSPGPILASDKSNRLVAAARLARFMDQLGRIDERLPMKRL
ncbi:hypothetical protein ACPVPU_07315 [Sphingomonas sp. CJ99]